MMAEHSGDQDCCLKRTACMCAFLQRERVEGRTGKVDPGFLQGKGDVGVGEWEQKC